MITLKSSKTHDTKGSQNITENKLFLTFPENYQRNMGFMKDT